MLSLSAASGQMGRAELFGAVRDSSGLPVAGASVQAQEQSTGAGSQTVTNEAGEYHFFALASGDFVLTVSKPGFATLRRAGIELRGADRIALDLHLQVGDMAESIEVNAAPPLLQTTSGVQSFVVDRKKLNALPLDGRNFVSLIALAPGVAMPPGSTSVPSLLPRINGSRPRTSEYIYDGISVLQPEPGQVAYFAVIDAIQEFRVQINSYSAEYGRSNGGVIQVSTKSGTNEFHGTLFEYFRNQVLNARNYFAGSGAKPPFKRNQYGLVAGGPIQRNRTFFFADWQGTRLRIGNTRFSSVPTRSELAGVFSEAIFDPATTRRTDAGNYIRDPFPNNTLPAGRFDATAASLLHRYPASNAGGTANNYRRLGIDTTDQDLFDTRLDRYFVERHRVFGRYTYLRDSSAPGTPLPDGSGNIASGVIGNTLTRADSVATGYSYTISPEAVNQVRFGFSRRGFQRTGVNTTQAAPIFQIAGFQQLGPPESAASRFTTSVTQLIDTHTTIKGRHSLKFGTDIRLERLDVLQPPDPAGLYSFSAVQTAGLSVAGAPTATSGSSLASFLLGQVNAFNIDIQQQVLKPRATVAEFFAHDDWRISQRLTLSFGLRYTLNFPSTEANNRGAVFNLNTQQLEFLGKNGISRAARRLDLNNFGPRVSLAYKLTDSFVIRSGYGLVWIEQAGITTPFTVPFFPFIQSVGQKSPDNIHPAFLLSEGPSVQVTEPNPDSGLGQGVFGVDRKTGSGYAQQWNFTLQKTFGTQWTTELGYLGSKLTHLGVPDTNLNQLPASSLALGSQLTQQVANPFFGQIPASSSLGGATITRQQLLRAYPRFTTVSLFRNNIGNSTYHAFGAHLERRFSRGLTMTASYTFSKLIDDASSVFDASILTGPPANFPVADSYNRRLEKDLSNGDIPHVLSSGFVYQLPFGRGWQVAGVIRIQSGMPVAVTQITNFNSFAGYGTQRPNRTRDPNLPSGQRSVSQWFNTAAFVQAPQFAIGNSSRNPVRGPGYRTADLMLGKTFPLKERMNLEFRAEVFNVSNTPPLGQPNGVAGNAAFGSITSAFDPRVFELALKVNF